MDIKRVIQDSLKIPVIRLFEPIAPPCATYYPVNDTTALAGDGKEEETSESYQIDIWDRDREEVKTKGRRLKASLMMAGEPITVPDITYQYDNNGKMWRATLAFSTLREE